MALRVPGQRQRRDNHIEYHKDNQTVAQHLPRPHRQLLNQPRQPGIDGLQPDHGGNAPEEAIQQIDAPAQVECEPAVVPEYRTERQFCKHAADIFISAAQQSARQEDIPVALVAVAVQEQGQKRAAKPPHDAEGPVDHAAAAHEHPCGQQAEYGLRDVPQKSADEKQRYQLIETAPRRENRRLRLGFFPKVLCDDLPVNGREGFLHTPLHPNSEPVLQQPGSLLHPLGQRRQPPGRHLHAQDGHGSSDEVHSQQPRRAPLQNQGHRAGYPAQQLAQHRIGEKHGPQRQQAPQQGISQAHISAQVVPDIGIIPQLFMEYLLHQHSRSVFQHTGQQHSAQEQEEGPVRQLRQEHREQHGAEPIDRAHRAVHESPVHELPAAERGKTYLHAPAQERIDEK